MKERTPDEIVKLLNDAKDAYYNTDTPLMSDEEFDLLEERLRDLEPENDYFKKVGHTAPQTGKIIHPVPLLSMDKAKNIEGIEKWIKRLSLDEEADFIIEPKIDGLSATCRYKGGNIQYVATRGDGIIGQDISHVIPFIDDIHEDISFSDAEVEIRGELYLPRNTEYPTGGRPLRNICVGLINRKEEREDLRHVRFAAFGIVGLNAAPMESEKLDLLKEENFNTVVYHRASSIGEIATFYKKYLDTERNAWEYETDGLIVSLNDSSLFEEIDSRWVVDHHHHYAIALKPPADTRKTALLSIEWQVSRQGNVIPVAVFEPVIIGGATLERATLSNYENVKKMDMKTGDSILVERANDVIPYVKENLGGGPVPEESQVPAACPSCGTGLVNRGVHLSCPSKECPEQHIQQILYWVKKSGIENVAEATIRTLYERDKIRSVKDIYHLSEKDFEGVEGFGPKKTANFIEETARSRKMTPRELIAKLGIPLVQKKSLERLGIASIDDFLNFNDSTYVIGQKIISWKEDGANMELFRELTDILDIQEEKTTRQKGKVAMTGKGPLARNEIIKIIEERGYAFSNTVTKDTDILLCEDPEGSSSKLAKAKKNGTKLLGYGEFLENL